MKMINEGYIATTNSTFESTEFKIGNVNKIVDLLISQYKYPIRTLVQEYISNGLDATIESGGSERLVVQLPNKLNNNIFSVRDYGVGLSPHRVANIFTVMGNSTKATSNDQIGGFGLGAKSALSYTSSFIVKTIVDKVLYHYIIRKGDEGGIVLSKVLEEPIDDVNGTTIEVSCKDGDGWKFRDAFYRCTMFWDKDIQPYVNEMDEDRYIKPEGVKLNDNVIIHNKDDLEFIDGYYSILFTLGGIPYTVDYQQLKDFINYTELENLLNNAKLVIDLKMGTVMPIQTREALNIESQLTKRGLQDAITSTYKRLEEYLENEIWKTNTLVDRIAEINKVKNLFSINIPDYKGFLINSHANRLEFKNNNMPGIRHSHRNKSVGYGKTKIVKHDKIESIGFNNFKNVYYKDISESMVMTNRRINNALLELGISSVLLLSRGNMSQKKFSKLVLELGVKRISLLELPVIVPRPRSSVPKVKKTVFDICIHRPVFYGYRNQYKKGGDTWWVKTNTKEKVVYYKKHDGCNINHTLYNTLKSSGYIIGGLADSYIKKIQGNDNFIELSELLKTFKPSRNSYYKARLSKFISTFNYNHSTRNLYFILKKNMNILQPTLQSFIKCINIDEKGYLDNRWNNSSIDDDEVENLYGDKYVDFLEKLKLFSSAIEEQYPLIHGSLNNRDISNITKNEILKNDIINYIKSKEIK